LARPPKKITLLEVVEAVEGPIRGQAPAIGKGEAAVFDRRLEAECHKVAELARRALGKVSIKELAAPEK
jgi:DNA-binding IscR family transcriptional regulator